MKKIQQVSLLVIAAGIFLTYGCGPNDDNGAMDSKSSNKEGAVDSTRIPKPDSVHSSITVPPFIKKRNGPEQI